MFKALGSICSIRRGGGKKSLGAFLLKPLLLDRRKNRVTGQGTLVASPLPPLPLSPPLCLRLMQWRLQHICGQFLSWNSSLPAPSAPCPLLPPSIPGTRLWAVQVWRRQTELSGIRAFKLDCVCKVSWSPLMAASSFHHRALCGAADPPH